MEGSPIDFPNKSESRFLALPPPNVPPPSERWLWLMFIPVFGEMIPNLTVAYVFQNGLVQPPTSYHHPKGTTIFCWKMLNRGRLLGYIYLFIYIYTYVQMCHQSEFNCETMCKSISLDHTSSHTIHIHTIKRHSPQDAIIWMPRVL